MATRVEVLRRTGEGLLLLAGLGALSVALKLDEQPIPLRIAFVGVAVVLLYPVRRRLSVEAWLTDGPRTPGRHVLSSCLILAWFALVIAVGTTLGHVGMAALILPSMAVGFVGSYKLADVISDYMTSPQFMEMRPAADPAAEPTPPPSEHA